MAWTLPLLDQPLWLDELHSSWIIAGDWADVASRAEMGNQSPTYFWLLKLISWVPGQEQSVLRLPSLIAWLATVVTMLAWLQAWQRRLVAWQESFNASRDSTGRVDTTRMSYLAIAVLFFSICVDPMQMFFAIEARVYGVVQLLNLWTWILVVEIFVSCLSLSRRFNPTDDATVCGPRFVPWHWIAWTACASAMIHLHITTGLSLVFQFPIVALLAANLSFTRQLALRSTALAIGCLAWISANGCYVLYVNQNVWARRQQWTAFAGDSSLESLIHLFPALQILLPIAVCWILDLLLQRRSAKAATQQYSTSLVTPNLVTRSAWALAAICPSGLAWLLTRSELAPLLHYRFVIVAALPLYMLAGSWLLTLSSGLLRVLATVAIFIGLFVSQGPWEQNVDQWRRSRNEDWKSATEFVSQHIQSESQSAWCYAGLIEGYQIDTPLTKQMDEYLSYPLRGIYRVQSGSVAIEPHGLVGNRKLWLDQIRSTKQEAVWIIYRGPAERMKSDLEAAGLNQLAVVHPIEQFGRVSVACIKL